MEEVRQNDSLTSIPPAEKYQPVKDSQDHQAAFLPFRICLRRPTETKTQIFASQNRNTWLAFILKELTESNLQDKELIEKYLRHLYRHLCKARTVENAYRAIHSFVTYLTTHTNRSLAEITREDIEAFIEHEQGRGLKLSTVRSKLVMLRALLRFLIEQGCVDHEVLTRGIKIKLPERLPRAIEPSDVRQLLSVVNRVRDRAYLPCRRWC